MQTEMKFNRKQKLAGIAHLIIMILSYTSFIWLDWKLMLIGVALYYLQILIFGGCVLTFAQFGKRDISFTGYYLGILLKKLGFNIGEKKIKRFIDLLAPIFIILAIILQVVFKLKPIVRL